MTQQTAPEQDTQALDPKLCKSLEWVLSLTDDFDDVSSFCHMRAAAQGQLNQHEKIGKDFTDPEMRKREWDDAFKPENDARREAIRLIDERLAKLGIDQATVERYQRSSPMYSS